jgi:tetratricopeptide (TPR) repeat protein
MAIRGNLREASLPDVLQLLAMGKKTGCLSIAQKQSFGNIYFNKGRISFASVINRRDRLGDVLVKHGLITRTELDSAIAEQTHQPERRLGEILVAKQMIAREELHRYIKLQIEEAVYFLFTWHQGTFAFEADVKPEAQDFLVSINPESLLLEGARRIDEWSEIEKRIPSFDIVYGLDGERLEKSGVALTPEQEHLIPLLDGERDIAALIDDTGMGEFDVAKALFGLMTAGFVHPVGRREPAPGPTVDVRVAEHRNLGVAFYKTGMYAESLREFRRVAELRPRDAHAEFMTGLVALREKRFADAVRLFSAGATRPGSGASWHVNHAIALWMSGHLEEAASALTAAAQVAPNDASVQLARVALAVRRRDFAAARTFIMASDAAYGTSARPAVWYHYAGVIAALNGDLEAALAVWNVGVSKYPHAAILHNDLAAGYERRGRNEDALNAAERAALEEPSLAQVHKNLGDLHYRSARYDDALECYQRTIRIRSDLGGDVYLKAGNIRYRRGERDEATKYWQQALHLTPDNAAARNNLELAKRLP